MDLELLEEDEVLPPASAVRVDDVAGLSVGDLEAEEFPRAPLAVTVGDRFTALSTLEEVELALRPPVQGPLPAGREPVDEPLVVRGVGRTPLARLDSGALEQLYTDRLGSVAAAADGAGEATRLVRYEPFGELAESGIEIDRR